MTSKIKTGLYIHKSTKILYKVIGTGKTVEFPHVNMVIYQQLNMFPTNIYYDVPIPLQITSNEDFNCDKLIKIDE